MTPFDFVCAFYSVVLGVAVAQIMTDLGGLVEHREKVRTYWVHLLWIFTVLFASVGNWWSMWSVRGLKVWKFPSFGLVVAFAGAIYLASVLLFPRIPETGAPVDLKRHFFKNRRAFFSTMAGFWLLGIGCNWHFHHLHLFDMWMMIPGSFMLLAIGALFIENRWYHGIFASLAAVLHIGLVVVNGGAPIDLEPNADSAGKETKSSYLKIAELEIDPAQLGMFMSALKEVTETSVRVEPGVLAIYSCEEKDNRSKLRFFEMYTDETAFKAHIASPHFQKYVAMTKNMIFSQKLIEAVPVDLSAKKP